MLIAALILGAVWLLVIIVAIAACACAARADRVAAPPRHPGRPALRLIA